MEKWEGKKQFYPRAHKDLSAHGRLLAECALKGSRRVRPLDCVLLRASEIVLIEIKSPRECHGPVPWSAEGALKEDYIRQARKRAQCFFQTGAVNIDVARMMIFMAQAEQRGHQFVEGKWGFRDRASDQGIHGRRVKIGLAAPLDQQTHLDAALRFLGVAQCEWLFGCHSVTAIWPLGKLAKLLSDS